MNTINTCIVGFIYDKYQPYKKTHLVKCPLRYIIPNETNSYVTAMVTIAVKIFKQYWIF